MAVARLKVMVICIRIISIMQKGHEVSLIIDESQNAIIDGQKLFALGSQILQKGAVQIRVPRSISCSTAAV